ncbi:T9SS type A sorting domain-containing protein [Tenacibaculum sp. 190524A02b]|uniref:T9SS type A sorting domain-containing protein n=1 Tax=Tenacibaculum vairaonense TaxID=3137860 RepID=UPI0031FACC92
MIKKILDLKKVILVAFLSLATLTAFSQASITSPVPSSTLTGPNSSVIFTIDPGTGGVPDLYDILIGTTGVGSTNVRSSFTFTGTTRTVQLPTSGETLYVRLWWRIGGIWSSADYTYTAFTLNGKAEMTSPTVPNGITGASATFMWSQNSADQYDLKVGTSPGDNTYGGSFQSDSSVTSQTISVLPTDGTSSIYVRLWSRVGGEWAYIDYVYTAATVAGKAEMTSPTTPNGITGASATFMWNQNSAEQYDLKVGTSPGNNAYGGSYQSDSSITSETVSGLPTDGTSTIYVRLWSRISGQWSYNDYTYTAATVSGWDGSTSSDWTDGTNWAGNTAPTTGDNIAITTAGTSPIIGTATNAEVNGATIEASSSLNIQGSLTVNDDFTNNGTVTMTSTAGASASLLVKGTSSGTVTYERGGLVANEWSIITAPVSGQSIKEFVENAANGIRINTTATPNRYAVGYYDDSRPTGTKWVYYTTDDLTTNTLTFEQGRSYTMSRATNGSVTFTGTLATTDVNKSVAASQWNAIGNPYTTYLPVNENGGVNFIQDNNSNLDPSFIEAYIWDNTQDKYVASSLASAARSLAPGQGFFVRTGSTGTSITFKESLRTVQNVGGTFNKGNIETPTIELSLKSKNKVVKTKIAYSDNASLGIDPGYDIGNFDGANLDVYTRIEGTSHNYTIQSLPMDAIKSHVIPLGVNLNAGTDVEISASSINLPEGTVVYLEDRLLETETKLSDSNTVYKITTKEKIDGVGRFFIHTKSTTLSVADVNTMSVNIYNTIDKNIVIEGITGEDFTATIFNSLGIKVQEGIYKGIGKNSISAVGLSSGVYVVHLVSDKKVTAKKVIVK